MVKNFFEYVKELIPEKGEIFFTEQNHRIYNAISLYQLADLLCGKKINFAEDVTAYSWKVLKLLNYGHEMMGLMFWFSHGEGLEEPEEAWIHFSKNAFIGAICIVATRNDITFDNSEFENARQAWARKIENQETEEDKKYTDLNEANFTESWYYSTVWQKEHEKRVIEAKLSSDPEAISELFSIREFIKNHPETYTHVEVIKAY